MLIRFDTVIVTPEVESKLWNKHAHLTQLDVLDALEDLEEPPRWDISDDHGGRVLAKGRCRNGTRLILMALQAADPELTEWILITAFDVDG